MIGQTISHYKILEKLGEGGMGVVYKAQDLKLDRTVALKFLPPHVSISEDVKARFLQEAKAAAALNHAHICTIHGIEEIDGSLFIVMEYVDGGTLREKIPFSKTGDAINVAIQIGEALQEAHAKGIVHRDVKADNVMLTSKGQAKVMDFGLAKLRGAMKLTRTSSTVGTLAYMPPEQIQGGEVDHRSDIFSFGVLLFEMLTGKLPFRGEHEAAMVYSIVNEDPQDITQYVPDVSPILLNLVQRCLEKDPAERYQHFDDIIADLKRAMRKTSKVMRSSPSVAVPGGDEAGTAIQSVPAERTSTTIFLKRSVQLGLGAAILVIIVAAVWFMSGSSRPAINPKMTTSVLQIPATEYRYPDMSPDGKWLAFPGSDLNGKWDIYMMFIETGESRRLTKDSSESLGGSATASFSPDGSSIAYARLKKGLNVPEICVVSVLTGATRVLADSGVAPKWSPNGDRVFYFREGSNRYNASRSGWREYWSVSSQGNDARIEFIDSLMKGNVKYFTLNLSPDGKNIIFTRPTEGNYNEIFIHNLASGNEIQLTHNKKLVDETEWTNNGYIFYSSNRSGNFNIWAIPEDGGDAAQITRGSGPDGGISVSIAANRMIYSQSLESSTLWSINVDGTKLHQLYPDENIEEGAISPDGKTIAMSIHKSTTTHTLMTRDISGDAQEILIPFKEGVSLYSPEWSPSGRYLAFLEITVEGNTTFRHARIIDMSGGRQVREFGEGIIADWVSDSVVIVIRNISKDSTKPNFNETRVLNINTGKEKVFSKDSTRAFPVLNNSAVIYRDNERKLYLVSRSELTKNPNGKGRLVFNENETYWAGTLANTLYYVPRIPASVWEMDLRTLKKSKICDIPEGDNSNFQLDKIHHVLTFCRSKNKTSIVKVDNLFAE
jgi:Tol biopolymer transport system component